MAGSILFTLLLSLGGGIPLFTLAWMANRGVQSLGWAGMVKIASRWFSYSAYGKPLAGSASNRKLTRYPRKTPSRKTPLTTGKTM